MSAKLQVLSGMAWWRVMRAEYWIRMSCKTLILQESAKRSGKSPPAFGLHVIALPVNIRTMFIHGTNFKTNKILYFFSLAHCQTDILDLFI